MIVIVDSGLANLKSIYNAVTILGAEAKISSDPKDIELAERIIVPGVGTFAEGMANLHRLGLVEPLRKALLVDKKPYLGICLGMHLLASWGHEFGTTGGLEIIPAEVKRFAFENNSLKIPHMGWNNIITQKDHPLLDYLKKDKDFYFVHSYNFIPASKDCIMATCDYGGEFVAAVAKENIIGLQFHPEKSQKNGLAFLERFIEWTPEVSKRA